MIDGFRYSLLRWDNYFLRGPVWRYLYPQTSGWELFFRELTVVSFFYYIFFLLLLSMLQEFLFHCPCSQGEVESEWLPLFFGCTSVNLDKLISPLSKAAGGRSYLHAWKRRRSGYGQKVYLSRTILSSLVSFFPLCWFIPCRIHKEFCISRRSV